MTIRRSGNAGPDPRLMALAKRIIALEKKQRDRTPQLTSSSIEDGALLEYDRDGSLVQIIGKQHDLTHGAFGVNGPIPPTPDGLSLAPVPGGLDVSWNGTFEDDAIVPMDFQRIDIVVGLEDDYDTQNAPPIQSIVAPRGGTVFVALPPLEQFVVLRCVSQSGQVSLPSVMASATPLNIGEPEPDPAPTESPLPVPSGLPREILLKIPVTLNADEVLVYVNDVSPVPIDVDHLHGTATGTTYLLDSLADGTELEPGQKVYVVVIGRNETGDAPPSPEFEASTRLLDAHDFTVDYLYAGAVDVGQLTGGTFDLTEGEVNVIQAVGTNGSKVVMDGANGFFMTGPEEVGGEQGPMLIDFPINGKPNIISGILEAGTLTVNQGSTLRGITEIAPGGQVVLGGQIQPPQSGPGMASNYHEVFHDGGASISSSWQAAGLTIGHDGKWYTTASETDDSTGNYVNAYDATTGAFVAGGTTLDATHRPEGGIVYAPTVDRYYLLTRNKNTNEWYVDCYDTTWTRLSRMFIYNDGLPSPPVIGWDFTTSKIVIARVQPDGSVIAQGHTPTSTGTMGILAYSFTMGNGYNFPLGFVARGSFDYGADRFVFRARFNSSDDAFKVYNTNVTPVRQAGNEWPRNNSWATIGAVWDGTRFWSLNNVGRRTRYEGGQMMWTGTTIADGMFELKHTWFDSDNVSNRTESVNTVSGSNQVTGVLNHFDNGDIGAPITGTGIPGGATITAVTHGATADTITISANATATGAITATVTSIQHETTPSPVSQIYMLKRQRMTATFGTIPGIGGHNDPNASRIYLRRTTSGTWARQVTVMKPKTAWSYDTTVAAEGGAVPGSNTFPFLSLSKLKATARGFEIDANSDGSIGTGTFRDSVDARADARIAALAAPAPVVFTTTASGAFGGSVRAVKIGNWVSLRAEVTRATGFNTSFTGIGMLLPWIPIGAAVSEFPAAPFWNSSGSGNMYQFRVNSDGALQLRQGAATGTIMVAMGGYYTDS